jgi:hypothetical protein
VLPGISDFLFACGEVDQQLVKGELIYRLDEMRVKSSLLRAPAIVLLTPATQGRGGAGFVTDDRRILLPNRLCTAAGIARAGAVIVRSSPAMHFPPVRRGAANPMWLRRVCVCRMSIRQVLKPFLMKYGRIAGGRSPLLCSQDHHGIGTGRAPRR